MVFTTRCGRVVPVTKPPTRSHIMNPSAPISTGVTAAISTSASTPAPARASRLERFFAIFARHAGAIAVDHTRILSLDRVAGRTGNIVPATARRCCC